jgi:hypothetical protein
MGFFATSIAIVGPVDHVCARFAGWDEPTTLASEVVSAMEPYVWYLLLALITHALLWLFRRTRRSIRATLAISLYVGGGPSAAFHILLNPLALVLTRLGSNARVRGRDLVLELAAPHRREALITALAVSMMMAALAAFVVVFIRAIAALHRTRWWVVTLAMALAAGVTASLSDGITGRLGGSSATLGNQGAGLAPDGGSR